MPEHILMIEDDQRLAAMVCEYLSAAGWRVATRPTAKMGLIALEGHGFDALILDVMLPDLDGFEVCRRVRARSDVPILMLTARGEPIDRIVGLEIGADDYLPKPFEPRELLARLRAILRRRTGAAVAETLRFGNLELRHDNRQVHIDSQPRTLTGYQFDLLWVLAQNAGRVMSREALMDRLKGQSLEAFDRSIDVHISRIRAAIEDDPKQPKRVITIRGTGYMSVTGVSVRVKGDPRMLRRMVRNLFDNAQRHGHGTLIEATVEPLEGGGARLLVENQGPGVPEEERERIFERFYRPAGMREGADGGVGLGLALVRQIARHHHGEACCRERVGGGTRLEITLGTSDVGP